MGTTPAPTSPVTGNAVDGKKLYLRLQLLLLSRLTTEKRARRSLATGAISRRKPASSRFFGSAPIGHPQRPRRRRCRTFRRSTLSDKQAKDIYAYIRTFKSNSPESKDIPTLNAIVNAASRPYKP